eukprot:scaffold34928_cov154-Amphora_coffeaeformis.AAC.2
MWMSSRFCLGVQYRTSLYYYGTLRTSQLSNNWKEEKMHSRKGRITICVVRMDPEVMMNEMERSRIISFLLSPLGSVRVRSCGGG